MDILRKFFPFSFIPKKDVAALVVNLIIYIVVGAVIVIVVGLLSKLPLIGFLISIAGSLISLYITIGIVLSVLDFLKILK